MSSSKATTIWEASARRNAFAPPSPMRGCAEPAAHVRSREGLAARTLGVRVLKREAAAPLKRSDRLALGGRYYGVLSEASISSRDCLFQDVASRKIPPRSFLSCPSHPGPPAGPGARRRCRGQAPISVLHRAISTHWAPFPATSRNRIFVILEARLPDPRMVSRRTRCCGSEASEAIPFPGADSIFSSRCGAISG